MNTNENVLINTTEFVPTGIEAAFLRFLPAAREIPENEMLTCKGADLALQNVSAGSKALLANVKKLEQLGFFLTVEEVRDAPKLAEAVVWAAMVGEEVVESVKAKVLAEAYAVRKLLFLAADSAVAAGLLAEDDVAKARMSEKGHLGAAKQLAKVASLLGHNQAKLSGQTVATAERISRGGELAEQVLLLFNTAEGRGETRTRPVSDKNRLWTLLVRVHEKMRCVAPIVFGTAQEREMVPVLGARNGASKATSKPEETGKVVEAGSTQPVTGASNEAPID